MSEERWKAEQVVAEGLGEILAGLATGSPIDTRKRPFGREGVVVPLAVEAALEFFLPWILRQKQPSWPDSFDGFRFVIARKTGPNAAEFVGLALLITTQEWIAMDLTLELRGPPWFVQRVKCKIGEPGDGVGGMKTVAYRPPEVPGLLAGLPARRDRIPWVFEVDVELPA